MKVWEIIIDSRLREQTTFGVEQFREGQRLLSLHYGKSRKDTEKRSTYRVYRFGESL